MDFGRILDDWDKIKREHKDASTPGPKPEGGASAPTSGPSAARDPGAAGQPNIARRALEAWLDENGVSDKDADSGAAGSAPGRPRRDEERRRLDARRSEAVLDLHGMTSGEAQDALVSFLDAASRAGLEKVLVIHGKGLHSSGDPVLKAVARRTIEAHPAAGRFGEAERRDGGGGALWVLIRKRAEL